MRFSDHFTRNKRLCSEYRFHGQPDIPCITKMIDSRGSLTAGWSYISAAVGLTVSKAAAADAGLLAIFY